MTLDPQFPPDFGPDPRDARDQYFADMSINMPQLIKARVSEEDGAICIRKQDVVLRIPSESVEIVCEVLKWVGRVGLLPQEADQARDLVEVLARECEGR